MSKKEIAFTCSNVCINIFNKRAVGFHRQTKLFCLNFFEEKHSSSCSNQVGKVIPIAGQSAWHPALSETTVLGKVHVPMWILFNWNEFVLLLTAIHRSNWEMTQNKTVEFLSFSSHQSSGLLNVVLNIRSTILRRDAGWSLVHWMWCRCWDVLVGPNMIRRGRAFWLPAIVNSSITSLSWTSR